MWSFEAQQNKRQQAATEPQSSATVPDIFIMSTGHQPQHSQSIISRLRCCPAPPHCVLSPSAFSTSKQNQQREREKERGILYCGRGRKEPQPLLVHHYRRPWVNLWRPPAPSKQGLQCCGTGYNQPLHGRQAHIYDDVFHGDSRENNRSNLFLLLL